MTVSKIEGEYVHKGTNPLLRYVRTYEFKLTGVVYETQVAEPGHKSVRLELGVMAWGFWVLNLMRRMREDIQECIDITDMEKLRAAANEV